MSTTNTPNMNLIIPGVGTEPGPDYATDVNNSLEIIDRHDHTPGSGVLITPSAININTALTFAGNFATNVAGVTFAPQSTIPSLDTIYVSDVDLYFRDGDGNVVQITTNGGIAGSPGSIANLVSPASATYISVNSTFVWQSGVNVAANLDAGSILLRNLTPNSTYALTLSPPAALGSNYTLTLPQLPATTSFLTLDSTGNIDPSISTTLGITASNLATDSVTNSKIQDDAVTTSKILDGNVTPAKLSFDPALADTFVSFAASGTQIIPAGATFCTVMAWGGAGGGGGGGASGGGSGGGGGGASGAWAMETMPVVPGETINVTIGAGGAGGAPTAAGANGAYTQVTASVTGWLLLAPEGYGGAGGAGTAGGAGGDQGPGAGYTYGIGGNGGSGGAAGSSGRRSSRTFAAVAGMPPSGGNSGGGAGANGRLAAGTQIAGNNGANAPANSAAGGGGGSGGISGQSGGNGGSGFVTLVFNSTL